MKGPFSNNYAGIYYDPHDPANLWDLQNRQQFLRSAARHVPHFADSLFEATYPLMREWIDRHGSVPGRSSPGYKEYYSRIFNAIRKWAKTFNIEEDWVVNEAYGILLVAVRYAHEGINPLEAFGTWWREIHTGSATREFLLPAWNPRVEPKKDYIGRANKAWKQLRDEYVAAASSELERAGFRQVPARRKRQSTEELRFEWAVLHKCAGTLIEDLADLYREDTEVIRIAIARILNDLGFEAANIRPTGS